MEPRRGEGDMARVQAKNGDIWEMNEAGLHTVFKNYPVRIPVQNKEVFDQLVTYARERQSRMSQPTAGAACAETFDQEFIKRYKDTSLHQVADLACGARMLTITALHKVIENRLRKMVQAGKAEEEARAILDSVM